MMTLLSLSLEAFLHRGRGAPLIFDQVPFNTPLVVMFSSGTTGRPKGIVHSHGVQLHRKRNHAGLLLTILLGPHGEWEERASPPQ
jgi:acyl-coenzyme A synthetase/AMP-(fatty) acid ligase